MGSKVQQNDNGKKTDLSTRTLELCDYLIDGMTLSANADNFEDWAERIATARREIQMLLVNSGGLPIIHTPDGASGGLYG